MRWLVGAAMLLVVAIALNLGLLAFAMYALIGVIVLSRKLADVWSRESVGHSRDESRPS